MNYLHNPLSIICSAFPMVSGLPYPFSEWYFLGTVFLMLMLLDILVLVKIMGKNSKKKAVQGSEKPKEPAKPADSNTKAEADVKVDKAPPAITDVNTLKAAVKAGTHNLSYEDICAYEANIYKEMLGGIKKAGDEYPDENTGKSGVLSTIVDGINTKENEQSRESEHEIRKNKEKEQRLNQIDKNLNNKIPKSLAGNTVDDIDI